MVEKKSIAWLVTDFDFVVLAVSNGRPSRLALELLLQLFEGQVRPSHMVFVPRQGLCEQNPVDEVDLGLLFC